MGWWASGRARVAAGCSIALGSSLVAALAAGATGAVGNAAPTAGSDAGAQVPGKVRGYRLGQFIQQAAQPGDPAITMRAVGDRITAFYLLTPAMCQNRATGQLHQVTFTIVIGGTSGLPVTANGRANGSTAVNDVAPGTMRYRIKLSGKRGTARLHIVEEDAVQRCQSDPVFKHLRWVSHPAADPPTDSGPMPSISIPASPAILYP